MLHAIGERIPRMDETVFVAWNAEVCGSVELGPHASVWFGASVRADIAPITIGAYSNVQDNASVHVDVDLPVVIGSYVTIGHNAVIHGCTIGDGSLIGMGAVVLSGAVIGEESLVGAGALVTEGKEFPPRSLILGSPARVVRSLTDEEVERIRRNALLYAELARSAREEYREVR